MRSRDRHSTTDIPGGGVKLAPLSLHDGSCECDACLPARLSLSLAGRDVHISLRVAVDAGRKERPKLRAVADQRGSAPVGQRVAANSFLALFSPRGLPNLGRRNGLVAVDDS